VKFAKRARKKHAAEVCVRGFHSLYDAGGLAALGNPLLLGVHHPFPTQAVLATLAMLQLLSCQVFPWRGPPPGAVRFGKLRREKQKLYVRTAT